MSKFTGQLQLQFWNPQTRAYELSAHQGASGLERSLRQCIEAMADHARVAACGRPWRIAKSDRPTKNPRHHAPRRDGSSRTASEVCAQYLVWAKSARLDAVTYWAGKYLNVAPFGISTVNRVKPEDYFTANETIDAPTIGIGGAHISA